MIRARDRLELPQGVSLDADGLRDDVRGMTVSLNPTGIALIDAQTAEAMATTAVERFGAPVSAALDDACAFAAELNRRYLLNVHVRGGAAVAAVRWVLAALVLVRHGSLPAWPARRRALDTSSRRRAAFGAAAGALPPGVVGASVVLVVPIAAGVPPTFAAAAALAVALGVAVHEAGHALLLVGVPTFVGRRAARVAVIHRPLPPRRTALVALAGPTVGVALALIALALAWEWRTTELVAAQLALAPQAVALTVLTSDGRCACGAS